MNQKVPVWLIVAIALVAAFVAGVLSQRLPPIVKSEINLTPDPALAQLQEPIEPVAYNSNTFRADLEALIESHQFVAAIHLLDAVRIDQQITSDGNSGYYSIAGNVIQNPGTNVDYDRKRDYVMPGTGCCIDSFLWVDRAFRFAEKYNTRLGEISK